MSEIHATWGWVAIGMNGIVGLWGVLASRRDSVPRQFFWATGAAITALLVQVLIGVALMSAAGVEPGNQHVFYGVLIAVTFSFAYIYRAQFRKRPSLYYGLLLLFCMGLGIRGIATIGVDF